MFASCQCSYNARCGKVEPMPHIPVSRHYRDNEADNKPFVPTPNQKPVHCCKREDSGASQTRVVSSPSPSPPPLPMQRETCWFSWDLGCTHTHTNTQRDMEAHLTTDMTAQTHRRTFIFVECTPLPTLYYVCIIYDIYALYICTNSTVARVTFSAAPRQSCCLLLTPHSFSC